jgi:hypothetical protein
MMDESLEPANGRMTAGREYSRRWNLFKKFGPTLRYCFEDRTATKLRERQSALAQDPVDALAILISSAQILERQPRKVAGENFAALWSREGAARQSKTTCSFLRTSN